MSLTIIIVFDEQTLKPQECFFLLLSVYEVYTMSKASTDITRQLLPEVIENFAVFLSSCFSSSRQVKK